MVPFLSPDPARDQHFEETQSWNIYSYVQNNPTMSIDPTGMFDWNLKTRGLGALKMVGGALQTGAAYLTGSASAATGIGSPVVPFAAAVAGAKGAHCHTHATRHGTVTGIQHAGARPEGGRQCGRTTIRNASTQIIQGATGMSVENARFADGIVDVGLTLTLGVTQMKINASLDVLTGNGSFNSSVSLTEGRASKIFGTREGHLPDTPGNRALLTDVANDSKAALGADKYANQWSARLLPDGTQAWTQTRNGQIWNGGLNETPRVFNSETGLAALTKPRGN